MSQFHDMEHRLWVALDAITSGDEGGYLQTKALPYLQVVALIEIAKSLRSIQTELKGGTSG